MACLYSVNTQYTLEDFKKYTWTILLKKKHIIIFGILFLLICFSSYLLKNPFYVVFAMAFTVLTVLLQNRTIKKTYLSNKVIQNLVITFDFYDSYFIEKTSNGETKVEYDMLYKIIETKTNFYLMISKNQGYILKKSELPDGLEDFIQKINVNESDM